MKLFGKEIHLNIPSVMSSSSSFNCKSYQYDVFLSFRGEDTRKNFVDHLYAALLQHGIRTFKDDERLKKGKMINNELLKSIEESRVFIIIFSKNYASSSWCLDELVKIIECQKTTNQIAYPVFYDVEPSELRKQSGSVGEAFAKHNKEEVAWKWRCAMEETANLSGWDLRRTADGHEAKVIKLIVERVLLELRSFKVNVDESLIGMEPRMQDLESYLEINLNDVRMIGIKGMGGAGKTTLARAIFHKVAVHFEGISFVENVREVSKDFGLKSLQKQVLSDVLKDQSITVCSVYEGKSMMKNMLHGKKVLLVLDDVDHKDQLEALVGEPNWFNIGSRIIITTRDEQVLVAHRVKWIHDINLLSHKEAICLFSRHAFGRDIPIQGYEELSLKVVRYAAGLPLTIRVLGSFLCGKDELEWMDALERLKKIPLKETLEKLELSYIDLEDDYKEIFLDVACLLKGWPKDDAIRILESCGFHARNGLRVLEQKSLLTISSHGYIGMHDHIEEMGKNIVRRLHPDEPNKHSRLWIRKEIEDVLASDLGTEATRCVQLLELQLDPKVVMKGLGNMKRLRCLIVDYDLDDYYYSGDMKIDQDTHYFPNALRFLSWDRYPHWCLPKTFQANNLVALQMSFSRIIQLWEGGEGKVLNNLRFLDLSHSELTTLDLTLTPNLERLDLEGCCDLVEVRAPVGCLKKLVFLDLSGCSRFKSFLFTKTLKSLDVGSLTGLHLIAKSLDECPLHFDSSLPKLEFTCNYTEHLPSSIGNIEKLISLGLCRCTKVASFSRILCGLRHLRKLKLEGSIPEVPEDLHHLECLEELNLSSTNVPHLPDSICMLKRLKSLQLKSCRLLHKLPDELGRLECLEELLLESTDIKHLPYSICMLKHLKSLELKSCLHLEKLPEDLGRLGCLKELTLENTNISHLPHNISLLKGLRIVGPRALIESCSFVTMSKVRGSFYVSEYIVD